MITIFIADDHALIREGFMRLIEKERDLSVIGEAENGAQVIKFVQQQTCDVLILDISMPGGNGLELIKAIKAIRPAAHILILTMHPEERFAIRALRLGAAGYITKISAPQELISAIRKVAGGSRYVSQSLGERLAFHLDAKSAQADHERLSDRAFEIFCLIAAGRTIAEIAEALSISQSTVNTHRTRILEKMQLSSNADIIHYAFRNNLVD